MKDEVRDMLLELERALNGMDVPQYRKNNPKWLNKNLGIRNKDHPNFSKAQELIKKLVKLGL